MVAASSRAGSGNSDRTTPRAAVNTLRVAFIQIILCACDALQCKYCAAASGPTWGQRWQQRGNDLAADSNVHQNRPVMQRLYWPGVERKEHFEGRDLFV